MYRVISVCSLCLFFTHAAVISKDSEAKIIKYENTNDGSGNYKFSFETTNGIIREETGHLVNIGQNDEHMDIEGFYSYTDDDGNIVSVNYYADETGYHIRPPIEIKPFSLPPSVVATLLGK